MIFILNLDPLTDEEIDALDPIDVNKFDRGAIGVPRELLAGDDLVFASLFLPLTFLTYGKTRRDFGMLAVLGAEVLLMNQEINLMAKGLTKRIRPYVYDPETPYDYKTKTKAKLSFYSGHTSNAACMTFFVAKVFSGYLTNKTTKAIIWGTAAVYPFIVGLARNDSANHFPTD